MSPSTAILSLLAASVAWSGVVWLGARALHRILKLPRDRTGYWLGALIISIGPLPLGGALAGLLALLGALGPDIAQNSPEVKNIIHLAFKPSMALNAGTSSEAFDLGPIVLIALGVLSLARLIRVRRDLRRIRRLVAEATPMTGVQATRLLPPAACSAGTSLRMADHPSTAFAWAGQVPTIILPRGLLESLDEDQLRLITAHEWAHLQRRDPQIMGALIQFQAIFCFNPFIRPLIQVLELAAELACDRRVLGDEPAPVRRRYAQTYLAALKFQSARVLCETAGPALPRLPAAFSPHHLRSEKMRVQAMLKPPALRRKRPLRTAAGAVLVLILTLGSGLYQAQVLAQAITGPHLPAPLTTQDAKISSTFGMQLDALNGRQKFHRGIDLPAERGTSIKAPANGTVIGAASSNAYGRYVELRHENGLVTVYAHLDSILVKQGDVVAAGTVFAKVGSTGRATHPHLHLEVRRDGEAINPESVFDFSGFERPKEHKH